MNLRQYREQAGITQKQLEEISGVKQVTISKLERGESEMPTLTVARQLIEGLQKAGVQSATMDAVFPAKPSDAA